MGWSIASCGRVLAEMMLFNLSIYNIKADLMHKAFFAGQPSDSAEKSRSRCMESIKMNMQYECNELIFELVLVLLEYSNLFNRNIF